MDRLTDEEVVTIIGRGRHDDHAIAEIIATGATLADLLEALGEGPQPPGFVEPEALDQLRRAHAQAAVELTAVAPRRPPAEPAGFDEHDRIRPPGEMQRRR